LDGDQGWFSVCPRTRAMRTGKNLLIECIR